MTLSEGLADIGSALGALQKASDILKAWTSLASDKERRAKISEINGQILAAQTSAIQANAAQAALIEQVGALKAEIARFEAWDSEKERYELRHIRDGAFAYVSKNETAGAEPPHWICTACYQNRKRSILQPSGPAEKSGWDSRKTKWACSTCGASIRVHTGVYPSFDPHDQQPSP
jgi:hypothetical protein